MKTTTKDPAPQKFAGEAWQRRAREQLEVAPEAGADEIRAAMLARLEDEDFVPPAELRQAFEFAAANSPPAADAVPAELLDYFERSLRGEIDAFTDTFFQLTITDRRQRWQHLLAEGECYPQLASRLKQLEPGLEVDCAVLDSLDSTTRELGEHACRLFLLPAKLRTVGRESLLERMATEKSTWRPAARALRREARQFARLAPDLIGGIRRPRPKSATPLPQQSTSLKSIGITSGRTWMWVILAMIALAAANSFNHSNTPDRKSPGLRPRAATRFPADKPLSSEELNTLLEAVRKADEIRDQEAGLATEPSDDAIPQDEEGQIRRGTEYAAKYLAAKRKQAAAEARAAAKARPVNTAMPKPEPQPDSNRNSSDGESP